MYATSILAARGDGQGALWLGVVVGLFVLLALPLAIVARTHLRLPGRARDALSSRPWLSRGLGVANLLLFLLLATLAGNGGPLAVVTFVLWLALVLLLLLGLAGVAAGFGTKLVSDPAKGNGAGAFTLGWLVLSGVPLFPVFGWLAFLWFAAGAIGAALLALGPRNRPTR